MTENENNKIKKEVVLIFLALCIFCGMVGYSFGADAGYAKGLSDCSQRSIAPISIQSP